MKLFITIILFLSNITIQAQVSQSLQLIDIPGIVMAQEKGHHHHYSLASEESRNEIEVIVTSIFVVYKNFISSQDSRSCVFSPSCSTYALETIKKNGLLLGFLDAIDRLTRCNGFSPEKYEYDQEQNLLIDHP